MKKFFLLIFFVILPAFSAVKNQYDFQSSQEARQFYRITNQLRCMVCQNETIAASSAGFANGMRTQVYQMVKAGKTDSEIKKYMVARYGNFILFKPPFNPETYLLWLMPTLLFLTGLIIFFFVYKKYRSRS